MFYLGLVFALFLPGFLSPHLSLGLGALCVVLLLLGVGGRGLAVCVFVTAVQLGRLTQLAIALWPQDFQASAVVTLKLHSQTHSRGQAYGDATILDGPYAGPIQLGWSVLQWRGQIGETWRVRVKLKGIAVTPAARDMAFAQLAKGTRGRARIQRGQQELIAPAPLNYTIRKRWHDSLAQASPAGAWLGRGMLLGEKPNWGQARQAALEQSGLGHLFSPSGLHLAMAVGLISVFLPSVNQFRGGLMARRPSLVLAVALVVWTLPTRLPITRAFLGFVLLWANRGWRRWDVSTLWYVCLCACLVIWPAAAGQSATALSFGAVGWILVCHRSGVSRLRQACAVLLGLSSLSVLMGLGAGVMSVLSNALWVPLVGLLGAPALIFGLILGEWWPWSFFSDALLQYLSWIPHYSLSWAQGALLACLALAMLWPVLAVGVLACLPLFFVPPAQGLWLYSVGAGQAARLSVGGQHWMIDAAPAQPGQMGAVGWEAIPQLRSEGVRQLDRVILSHGDADHAGGFEALAQRFSLGQVLSGEPGRTQGAACFASQHWAWASVRVHVHWGGPPHQKNAASCVVEIQVPAGSIWILGDAPREQQWALARAQQGVKPADIVVAAHHGARDGFSVDVAQLQNPAHVVFSQAKFGRWAHPAPEVEQGWQAVGAQTWRLGQYGTLYIDLSQDVLTPKPLYSDSYWTRVMRKTPGPRYAYGDSGEDPA